MLVLRPYRTDDREGCLDIFDSNVPAFFAPHERAGFASFVDALASFTGEYLVLLEGERVIGCGGVGLRDDEARMCWGIIDRIRQGEQLGRLLLLVRLVRGAELGAKHAGLDTIPATVPFFEREGFIVTGGEDDHYGPGIHRRDLSLVLDAPRVATLRASLDAALARSGVQRA